MPTTINNADTAWLLISTALVMLMTPGLALFYAGMVRSKNVLGTIMQSFTIMALISVQWVLWGYSLSFAPTIGHIIGNLSWLGLRGVGLDPNPDYAATVPHQAFMIFQGMFAVITPALITGAFAERKKFSAFLLFTLLWAMFVYDPIAHWVWSTGGWLRNFGTLDFAGGTVVHISSGAAALAAALVIGKRRGFGSEHMPPHNLVLTILGAGILWFGWFGFNAGSAITSGALSTNAFVVTNTACAAAALTWMVVDWLMRGKPTALGVASGAVTGLVAITPGAGFVGPLSAIIIGAVAGIISNFAIMARMKLKIDDSLDVVAVHGMGGTWGALATGFFAQKTINSAGADGFFFGNPGLVGVQFLSIAVTWVYSFVLSFALLKLVDKLIGLRVSEEDEETG
ncbi:MAG: ammonium transporter, partial [bacterium]|nr:ammonium transporter [bacterium]